MSRLVITAVLLAAACSASTGDGSNGGVYGTSGGASSGGSTLQDASVDDASADASAMRPPGFIVFSSFASRGAPTVIRHTDPAAAVIRKYNCVQGLGAVY